MGRARARVCVCARLLVVARRAQSDQKKTSKQANKQTKRNLPLLFQPTNDHPKNNGHYHNTRFVPRHQVHGPRQATTIRSDGARTKPHTSQARACKTCRHQRRVLASRVSPQPSRPQTSSSATDAILGIRGRVRLYGTSECGVRNYPKPLPPSPSHAATGREESVLKRRQRPVQKSLSICVACGSC